MNEIETSDGKRSGGICAFNLHERGYSNDDINLIMSDETRKKHFSGDTAEAEIGTKAAEGAGKGSAVGGTVGAIAGVIVAIGTSLANIIS